MARGWQPLTLCPLEANSVFVVTLDHNRQAPRAAETAWTPLLSAGHRGPCSFTVLRIPGRGGDAAAAQRLGVGRVGQCPGLRSLWPWPASLRHLSELSRPVVPVPLGRCPGPWPETQPAEQRATGAG